MRYLRLSLLALSLCLGHASAQPLGEPGVHVVVAGQRLESIARRYAVSVDAICTASGIPRHAKLRVGQRLVIPAKGDADGSEARAAHESGTLDDAGRSPEPEPPEGQPASTTAKKAEREERSAPRHARAGAEGVTAAQAIHRVRPGQTLGKIAQRYGVSVEALRAANRIGREPLRVGQELLVPAAGSTGQAKAPAREAPGQSTSSPRLASRAVRDPLVHEVAPGHTLGKLAKRYQVSVDEICAANSIDRRTPLKLGQRLVIPPPGGGDGAAVRRLHAAVEAETKVHEGRPIVRPRPARQSTRQRPRTWRDYAEKPARPGRVTLIGYNERWTGFVTGKRGKVLPQAVEEVSRVMGSVGKRPRADARLVKLIARVSDTFGGRPIRVVSGYRFESYFQDSRHRTSQALDFSIPGVPNEAVRDFLRTLDDVGVGYYPNSSFVHMDTRTLKTYWVDYSGPGEAPRRSSRVATGSSLERSSEAAGDHAGPVAREPGVTPTPEPSPTQEPSREAASAEEDAQPAPAAISGAPRAEPRSPALAGDPQVASDGPRTRKR